MRPTRFTDEMVKEYVEKGYWTDITYPDLYERNAKEYGDKEAFVDDAGNRVTWAEANRAIDRLALKLAELGFEKDDRLMIQLPNRVELILMRVACEKAGVISIPVVRTLRHAEIGYILKLTEAKGYVGMWKFRDFDYWQMIQELRQDLPALKYVFICGDEVPDECLSLKEILSTPLEQKYSISKLKERQIRFDEVAWIELSTGTTGFPKVIETPLALATSASRSHMAKLKMTGDDVVAAFAPVSGAGRGLARFTPFVAAKGVLMEHFEVEGAFKLIEKEKITIPMVVPTQLAMMLESESYKKYDLSSLRVFQVAGAPLPPHVAAEVEEKFKCLVINHYGGMDAGSLTSVSVDDPVEVRRYSVGKPHPGNEIKLLSDDGKEVPVGEVGTVHFRGPCSVGGYYKDPEMTKQAWGSGWFNMGDLGKFDEKGNLYLVGRKKDIIIRGGFNIYPAEVEAILASHPKVAACAVVGYPDPVMGERACAFVVPKPGETFTFDEMVAHFKERKVQAQKTPERLEIVERLPLVSDMKIDKKVLKEQLLEKLRAEGKV
jgi:non-ribosomal peptide synthetase component E (peptide arylation enzyme)